MHVGKMSRDFRKRFVFVITVYQLSSHLVYGVVYGRHINCQLMMWYDLTVSGFFVKSFALIYVFVWQ